MTLLNKSQVINLIIGVAVTDRFHCVDYMDPDVRCPKKAIKLNHSLTHSLQATSHYLANDDPYQCCHMGSLGHNELTHRPLGDLNEILDLSNFQANFIDWWMKYDWLAKFTSDEYISGPYTEDKSRLVQVMAWCCQATSHYLSQCCSRSVSPYELNCIFCGVSFLWLK